MTRLLDRTHTEWESAAAALRPEGRLFVDSCVGKGSCFGFELDWYE